MATIDCLLKCFHNSQWPNTLYNVSWSLYVHCTMCMHCTYNDQETFISICANSVQCLWSAAITIVHSNDRFNQVDSGVNEGLYEPVSPLIWLIICCIESSWPWKLISCLVMKKAMHLVFIIAILLSITSGQYWVSGGLGNQVPQLTWMVGEPKWGVGSPCVQC